MRCEDGLPWTFACNRNFRLRDCYSSGMRNPRFLNVRRERLFPLQHRLPYFPIVQGLGLDSAHRVGGSKLYAEKANPQRERTVAFWGIIV